ncbi:MAG: UvrD-helicase domain-containing protein, partial [Spirochaetota bacterium]
MDATFIKKLDSRQREAVKIDENAVVSAGAGSGKTTVLAGRYVRLICEKKARIENILTLTFTRKAAAEMYARIYSLLVNESDKPHVQEQLAQFDQAQIATIDSFCAQIVRNSSERFGVSPDFTITEETPGNLT